MEGSLILPHHGSEFTHSDLLRLHSPSARANAVDAFVNCDKTFLCDPESPPYAEALLGRLLDLGPDNVTLQFFATYLSVTLFVTPFVTPAYGERARNNIREGWNYGDPGCLSFVSRARGSLLCPWSAGSPFALRLGVPKRSVVCSVSR